jgi:two-component system, NtrC family, nitrogen regulation sensor histidine kinase NtrY
LSKKIIIPRFITKNIYLPVVAAWLVTLSFLINNYWSSYSNLQSVQKKMKRYVHDTEKEFISLMADSSFMGLANDLKSDDLQQEKFSKKKYNLFLYNRHSSGSLELKYWNTQNVLPDSGIIYSGLKAGFAQLPNGFYVWNKLDTTGVLAIALIPIKWNYIVTNDYLKNDFIDNPLTGQPYDIFPGETKAGSIKSIHGIPLFYLVQKINLGIVKDNVVSIWLRVLAALLILMFIHLCAEYIATKNKLLYAGLFLAASIIVLRTLSYIFPVPLNLRQFELFDPTIYGSNFILRSLGDLLINTILFVWFIMFVRQQVQEKKLSLTLKNPVHKWAVLVVGTFIILAATYTGVYIIRSLIADSKISFDVINFFSVNNIYSVLGFIVLCNIAVGYYFLCQLMVYIIKPFFSVMFAELYLCTAILGLLLLSFKIGTLQEGLEIFSLAWLLLFLFLLNSTYLKIITTRIVSSKLVFWIIYFSISMTTIIIVENSRKELRNRQHYAEILATKTDPASEPMLNSMLADFRVEFLSGNFNRLKNLQSNKYLKDSLINNNFSGYTNRYDTYIYSFDEKENPLFNDNNAGYDQLNTILNTQSKATGVKGLFYYDESYDRFGYISKKVITDVSGVLLGTIFIVVTPKMIKNEMLFPELFSKGIKYSIENSSVYAFAIYNKNKLINSHNDYPFSTSPPPQNFKGNEFRLVNKKEHDELWYNAGLEKYIVIVKEKRQLLESITLFSYLFCAFLLLSSCFWVLSIFISSRLNSRKLRNYWQLSIRNQIHGIIIFISAVSFLVIGVATILFFISRYESNNREKLSRVIQIMKNQVAGSLSEGWQMNDTMLVTEKAGTEYVEKNIINIANIHGVEVNIYDLKGDLKLASLPLPYVKGIVSTKMEPNAYAHLHKRNEVQYFQTEHIGNLEFVSSYVPVFDVKGNATAYLNIPYFTSEFKLQQEIANFLVTIINLNAFIFLIAGIVALFIANKITHSFSVIGEKMKKINLGKINEAIQWNRNDEIGSLVNEYNKMLAKLDESAAALAKTEREGAWKEMAKQVAHEIKNPLTPMKLSMQFLQRSIENNAPDIKALTASLANTMVEQIDHLSNIASEFSQFANIENANKEMQDMNESLQSIKLLYDGNEKITMQWTLSGKPIMIYADKTHVNRLFTNLIQNALQSVPENKVPCIQIEESVLDKHVLLKIKDNGEGIPENTHSKIFTPNFTTKTSGTGLGLAMCKRIVEQMNGKIWFETTLHEGTTFFIELPLTED